MTEAALAEFSSLEIGPLIADRPAEPRDSSRLLVVDRAAGTMRDLFFRDLPSVLPPGFMLVLNRSRVWKARLETAKPTGGRCELLLTGPLSEDRREWSALCRKMRPGQRLDCPGGVSAECLGLSPDGSFSFRFSAPLDEPYLDKYGSVPLPQYILNARKQRGAAAPPDEQKYQTVYAEQPGSIAAPTAGFHFTPGLLKDLAEGGVKTAFVTLHIGWGTFRPVRTEDPAAHVMMEEACEVTPETAAAVNAHLAAGGRLAAVGTSSMRTLETLSDDGGNLRAGRAKASLFIRPGYRFKTAGAFITNLHVPDSAPLYMTAAFAGRELLFKAYRHAVERRYRFYSYGDSMLVL